MLLPLILGTALLSRASAQSVPDQAQVVDQKKLNVLETVEPVATENLTTVSHIREFLKVALMLTKI